jgi:hypothetical protein
LHLKRQKRPWLRPRHLSLLFTAMSSTLVSNTERLMASCRDPVGAFPPENGYPFREHHFPPESLLGGSSDLKQRRCFLVSNVLNYYKSLAGLRTRRKVPSETVSRELHQGDKRRQNDRRFIGKRTSKRERAHGAIVPATSGKSCQARECSPRIMSYRSITAATPTSEPSSSSRLSTRTTRP